MTATIPSAKCQKQSCPWTVANPQGKARQAQAAKDCHRTGCGKKDAVKTLVITKNQRATRDGYARAHKSADHWPFHPTGALASTVEGITEAIEAEERADRAEVSGPGSEN